MTHFTPIASLSGGVLLGIASTLLYAANGRILGVSGIVGGLPSAGQGDRSWRLLFLAGLLAGGLGFAVFSPTSLALGYEQTTPVAVVSGLLVGIGTRLGNGCTSGHGLCGVARLSTRSLVATGVFMATAIATVFVVRHVLRAGGGS